MRIVVAVDKFKGSLSAEQAASHIATGLRAVDPAIEVVIAPVADGGDGTVDAAVAAGFTARPISVDGPTGEQVHATYAVLAPPALSHGSGPAGGTAVVELANTCGLELVPGGPTSQTAMSASTRGLGQAMVAALDEGCGRLVVGVGGSASTDAGAGMLVALGARITDADGAPVGLGAAGLIDARHVDLSRLHPRLRMVRLELASDVDNPLTGERGAAAVYGPQKGATPEQVESLDATLAAFARIAGPQEQNLPGAGAAGGTGYAALLLRAEFRAGIEVILEITGFADRMAGADLVITGEGSLDAQSLHGKAPVGVANAARAAGIPVVALAGRVAVDAARLRAAGIEAAYALTDIEPDVQTCIEQAGALLERRAADLLQDTRRRTS